MGERKRILIVDDEAHIREVIRFAFEKSGFDTLEAENGARALALCRKQVPDLIVLDILMPEMDGTEVCRELRKTSRVPILFLSSKDDEVDRIVGLEIGGDDYVVKPFSPREIVARAKAIFRRVEPAGAAVATAQKPRESTHNRLRLHFETFQAFWDDQEISLTVTEFGILRTLLGYPGKAFTRDELVDGAYALETYITDRTIDSHIRRIRQKFRPAGGDPIETIHGLGYKLGPCT
ncbi:MAG: response regulator transcription factor [Thermodesulfobacteriota bacterium]